MQYNSSFRHEVLQRLQKIAKPLLAAFCLLQGVRRLCASGLCRTRYASLAAIMGRIRMRHDAQFNAGSRVMCLIVLLRKARFMQLEAH